MTKYYLQPFDKYKKKKEYKPHNIPEKTVEHILVAVNFDQLEAKYFINNRI